MSEFDFNADWDDDGLAGLGDAGADEPFSYDFDGGFAGLSDAGFGDAGLDSDPDGVDAGDDGGYAELSEAGAETGDAELVETGADEGVDGLDGLDSEFGEFVEQLLERSFDTIGADPDEDGLWQQAMTDLHDDVNPYVAN